MGGSNFSGIGSRLLSLAKGLRSAEDLLPVLCILDFVDTGESAVRELKTRFSGLDLDRWYTHRELVGFLGNRITESAIRRWTLGLDDIRTRVPDQFRRVRVIPGHIGRPFLEFKGSCVFDLCEQQQQLLLTLRNTQKFRRLLRELVSTYAQLRGLDADLEKIPVGEARVLMGELFTLMAGFLGTSGITPDSFRASLDTPGGRDIYNQAQHIFFDSQIKPWVVNRVKPQMEALRRDAAEAEKKAIEAKAHLTEAFSLKHKAESKASGLDNQYLNLKRAGYNVVQENTKLKEDLAQVSAELAAYKASHPDKDASPEAIYTVSAYVTWVLGERMNPGKNQDVVKYLRSKNYFPILGLTPLHWAKSNLDKEAAAILRIIRPAPSKAVLPGLV